MTTLTLIVALPLLAAIGLTFVPGNFRFVMRLVALATTLVVALLGLCAPGDRASSPDGMKNIASIASSG